MSAYDWDAHPLGNPVYWPENLKANIRLMLNSGFPMFIWWTKELYMFNNDAYIPALGKKHPQALGSVAPEMWAEIWDQIEGIVADILQHGNKFYAENLLILLDRKGYLEETYWTFSYSPIFDDDDAVAGIFCACHETTALVLGQRRLKSLNDLSEELNQAQSLEQVGQKSCDILHENLNDLPFSLLYLNNETGTEAHLVGRSGNIKGAYIPDVVNLREQDAPWPLAQVQEEKKRLVIDLSDLAGHFDCDDGVPVIPRQAVILPVKRPDQGHVIGFFISGISARQEYNEAYEGYHNLVAGQIATSIASVQNRQNIIRQKQYLNEIFQQAPVGITMLRGREYVVEIANQSVCEIWRVNQQDVLGKPILDFIPEAADQGFIALLDGVMSTGVPFVANELPLVLERNGVLETVYLNFVYHPLRDAQGFITGIIAVAIDISEQVAARQKIEVINRELLATNADLDNFVYSASHDLKAPISNIEGLVHALQDFLPDDTSTSNDVQLFLMHIENSIERFKRVVTDLTQVTKIQREAGEDIALVDVADVISEVCLDFAPTIAAIGAQVETDISPDSLVQFSAKNLRSIVYNLLSNALKYYAPDRTPQIKISTAVTPENLVLTVADNGLGIDQAGESKIFSMFKRLHDHVEGSGIGLYIVKRIVENAGGRIEVESKVSKGATFRVYFKH